MLDLYRTPKRAGLNLVEQAPVGGGILMRVETKGMAHWWKRELVITELGLEWDEWRFQTLVRMMLPYSRIADVGVLWGPFADDLEVVGASAADNVLVRGLDKDTAQRVKAAIGRRLAATQAA